MVTSSKIAQTTFKSLVACSEVDRNEDPAKEHEDEYGVHLIGGDGDTRGCSGSSQPWAGNAVTDSCWWISLLRFADLTAITLGWKIKLKAKTLITSNKTGKLLITFLGRLFKGCFSQLFQQNQTQHKNPIYIYVLFIFYSICFKTNFVGPCCRFWETLKLNAPKIAQKEPPFTTVF